MAVPEVLRMDSYRHGATIGGIVSACTVILIWEVSVRLFSVPSYLLPSPSQIGLALVENYDPILHHGSYTLISIISGFFLGVVLGVPLAILLTFSRLFEITAYPIIVFLQIIPKIAIAPIFIIWFGFGLFPKVLLVFLLTFFPITVSMVAGLRSCDADLLELARSTGASSARIFFFVRIPSALPDLMTGLKVAAALAATAAIVAEFVAADRGLGYLLLTYNGEMNTTMVFATVLALGILGLVVYYAVEVFERMTIPWHVSAREKKQH